MKGRLRRVDVVLRLIAISCDFAIKFTGTSCEDLWYHYLSSFGDIHFHFAAIQIICERRGEEEWRVCGRRWKSGYIVNIKSGMRCKSGL